VKKNIFLFLLILLVSHITFSQQTLIAISSDKVNVLPANDALCTNGLQREPFQNLDKDPKVFAIRGWKEKNQNFTWNVLTAHKSDYIVAILLEVKGLPPSKTISIKLSSSHKSISLKVSNTKWNKIFFPGKIWLNKGKNQLRLELDDIPKGDQINISVYSIEISTKKITTQNEAYSKVLRSKPQWLIYARYGLFFHWNARSMPRRDLPKSYEDAVNDFNVVKFASMVHATGADFIVLTTSWDLPTFPAPLKSLDKILPGNTTSRDLIADLSDALAKWNIKLMIYCNFRINTMGWKKEDRFSQEKTDSAFDKMLSIYKEIGQRYAGKIGGVWIDDGMGLYPYNAPFKEMTSELKRYDKNMIVGYNSWIYPRFTDFQDFYCGEEGITDAAAVNDSNYLPKGGDGYFVSGPYKNLKATFCGLLEPGNWTHTESDKKIPPPFFTAPQLIGILHDAILRKNVPIMNAEVYQDGTISNETFALLKAVNEAIPKKSIHQH